MFSGIFGLQIIPVFIAMNRHVSSDSAPARGISASERSARIRSNPLRAAAIAKGRQRLAKVAEQLNPGVRQLSVLRLSAGLSQAELAQKLAMKQPNIARLEKKPGDPSLSTLQKLAFKGDATLFSDDSDTQQRQVKPLWQKVLEVFVQRDQAQCAGDGKGRQIGIHPDFGGRAVQRGQATPKSKDARWLVTPRHLGQGLQVVQCDQRITVGQWRNPIGFCQRRRGKQAQEALLRGTAKNCGLCGRGLSQGLSGHAVRGVLIKRGGQPGAGVKQQNRHVACPLGSVRSVQAQAAPRRSSIGPVR